MTVEIFATSISSPYLLQLHMPHRKFEGPLKDDVPIRLPYLGILLTGLITGFLFVILEQVILMDNMTRRSWIW